jgi:hydroxysqualene dehydroxylase
VSRVLVVGGGLAGITAALDCAQAGREVTLVEVRRRLGGAVYSFERDGLEMDNGQHVFLRCCTQYRALLRRLGSDHLVHVQPRLQIPVLRPAHKPVQLRRGSLPAPLHLAGALARYPHLSLRGRAGAAWAALALMRVDPNDPANDRETFGAWLQRHGQDRWAIAALWDLIALPTLNVPAAEASLALAAFVFRTGLLSGADAGDIGFHRGTLQQIVGEPAERVLADSGVEHDGERFELHGNGEAIAAQAAVVALPHNRVAALLGDLPGAPAAAAERLTSSPIVNLHVVYDRQVTELPFAAGVGTPVQYLFDRTAAAGAPSGCQYLAVSLSGAEREMQLSVEQLRAQYEPALAQLLPLARTARVERFQVTREHAATFRAGAGVGELRAGARTGIRGLALAGAWTDTGWPATLEGAVMSGHTAARVAVESPGE